MKKVQQAQLLFNLRNDGTLNPNTRAALNISLRQRREEVKRALNLFRYIACLKEQGMAALVNIPSASLFVYQNDSLLLSSKIIAGKPSTPTPTLSSAITDVIVYPYWNVPHKIATRELLPQIKRNRSFLTSNGFEVLSSSGRVLDPSQINWHSLSSSNFPYTLRQSTGCDNALGVLKFNFYNPFTVYLHDTPYKGLFFLNKRFFSHGCMRVEKPIELSQLLLQEKASDIDTLIRTCLKDQKPHDIKLEKPLPILVLYSTVWFNESGDVRFYEDVYHKNNFITNALVLDSITSSKQFLCLATKFIHSYSF
jgi:murein L,D-transpeptidase YcbB/YkuD